MGFYRSQRFLLASFTSHLGKQFLLVNMWADWKGSSSIYLDHKSQLMLN